MLALIQAAKSSRSRVMVLELEISAGSRQSRLKSKKQSRWAFAVFGMAALPMSPLSAAEVCVKCTGPDASYACIVNDGSSASADSALNLYCISALAQSGQHASCAIDRASVSPCQGTRRELPAPAGFGLEREGDDNSAATDNEPRQAGSTATPAEDGAQKKPVEPAQPSPPPAASADEQKPDDKPAAPPKTVQEMVEKSAQSASKSVSDANKSASDTMKKAGSAVNDAAKSTWKCLSSFFSDC